MSDSKIHHNALITVFKNAFTNSKKSWDSVLLGIFFVICLILTWMLLENLVYYSLIGAGVINITNVFLARLIVNIGTAIISFIIAVIAQHLIINSLLNLNLKFSNNLKGLKKTFWSLFFLTVIINVVFLIATLPIYVAVFLIGLNKLVIAMVALTIGLLLSLFSAVYLVFSPFILIDKSQTCTASITESYKLASKNLPNLIFNIILLSLIIIIFNGIGLFLTQIQILGMVFSSIIYLALIIFAFNYLLALYQNFKN